MDDARCSATSPDGGLRSAAREGTIAVCVPGCIREDGIQLGRVVDVRGCDLDTSDQPRILVGCDMGLVAVHRLATAMTCPARLAVMTDARRRDQRCIHQSAGANNDAALIELMRDGLKQSPVQAAAHQLGAEPHKGRALGRGLMGRETTEPPEAGPVIESFGQAHVGEVVPGGAGAPVKGPAAANPTHL